jgi:hypothetical protein
MYNYRDDWSIIVFQSSNLEEVKQKARAYKKEKKLLALAIQEETLGFICWV